MLIDKIFIMLSAFVLLSAVGFGPTMMLTASRYKRRLLLGLALSPAVGIIIIAFLLYILFLLDVPLRITVFPVTFAGIILSLVTVVLDWRARPADYSGALTGVARWKLAAVVVTWFGALLLLLLPPILGGESFQYYQSNTYDATNYVSMAFFGMDFPASYVANPPYYQEAVQHNPGLVVSMTGFANLRPSVSHLLAWESLLFQQSPVTLYFFHKLLSLLTTMGVAIAIGYQLGLRWWQRLALMLVSSVGFWVIYVVDIDALSHIFAIPLGLLVVFAFIQFEYEGRNRLFSRARWLLALSLAGLFCFYPEIFLPFAAALALYYVHEFILVPSRALLKIILMHTLTLIMFVLLLNIILIPNINFALGQYQFAANDGLLEIASQFFHWLFFDHGALLNGLWGLYYFYPSSQEAFLIEILKAAFILIMFVIMAAIIGTGILRSLTTDKAKPENRLLAMLIGVYWGGGLLLYLLGNDWVAGKTIAMGAPFMVIGAFFFFGDYFSHKSLANGLLKFGLAVWVLAQVLVLPIQALAALDNSWLPYTVYLSNPAFPKVIMPVVDRLRAEDAHLIGVEFTDPKPPVSFAFLMQLRYLKPVWFGDGIPSYYDQTMYDPNQFEWWMNTNDIPDYLVLSDKRDYLQPLGLGQNLIQVPSETMFGPPGYITAYAVQPDVYEQALYRADILNPDLPSSPVVRGMDPIFLARDHFVRWMKKDTNELRFIASMPQSLGVYMEYRDSYTGEMSVKFNDLLVTQIPMTTSSQTRSTSMCMMTKSGSNTLQFTHSVETTQQPDEKKVLVEKLLFVPVSSLDVGSIGDARQIVSGWELQENWGEENIRWAQQNAEIQLMTCEASSGQSLHFRAFMPEELPAQTVTVRINGTEIGGVELSAGWNEYTLGIPAEVLQTPGLQTIELRHSDTFTPDNRSLSAAYDRFWFEVD